MKVNVVFTVLCLVCFSWSNGEKLPTYITPCNRTDPDVHKCVEENIEVLRPNLKKGIPDLFIPSLDPLLIPPTCVNEEDQVKVTFTDIHIFHADNFRMDQFDIDLDKKTVNISFTFPHLRIKSTYNVNGKFLVVTFDEKGPADGNYSNFRIHLGLKGKTYLENGEEYLKWEKEAISTDVEDSHIVLEKLFGNHTDLSDKTNKVINENINIIINDLQPVIQRVVTDFIFGIVNKLFAYYPLKELFAHD
ncbi:protein takeout-like [Euwallacea fornicatus]|uniref:protein takeout-like n=1 Tax=Euwallacea fornicatus TaxID=995702 RepID=UPI00338D52C1